MNPEQLIIDEALESKRIKRFEDGWMTVFMWKNTKTDELQCVILPGIYRGGSWVTIIGDYFNTLSQGPGAWHTVTRQEYHVNEVFTAAK